MCMVLNAKMSRFMWLLYVTVLLLNKVSGEDFQEAMGTVEAPELMTPEELILLKPNIEKALVELETLAASADELRRVDGAFTEDPEHIYDEMVKIVDDIILAVKNSNNAYKFLKAKGLDRIIHQNLKIEYAKLKTRTLILLKSLFDVAPTSTSSLIPITVVDRLLDVFERDNLGLKAHALDVLMYWLPENPRVQARVMKIKGLAPFYEQVAKLDTAVIKTLLDLFNTILKEHIKVRSDNQRTVVDNDKMKFYIRIGLLEHMATPTVCNGLLNIFIKTWSYNNNDNNIIVTVFDILKNIQQYCLKIFRGQNKAKKLFKALQEYVKEPENIEYFEENGLNVTDISMVIEEYVEKLRYTVKDEM